MRNSIRTRLIIAFIGLAIGPLLLVGMILAWQSFVSQQQQALDLQAEVAQRLATQVTAFFEQQENLLRLVSQVQGLQRLDRDQQLNLLSRLLSYQNVFDQLILLDSQGREQIFLARLGLTPTKLGGRTEADEFVLPRTTGQVYYSPVRYDAISGEPLMTVAIPLLEVRTGQVDGVLIAETRLKRIWDLIAGMPVRPGQSVYIVDAQGDVVAHQNPSVVLRGTRFSLPDRNGIHPGLTGSRVVLAVDTIHVGQQEFHIVAEQTISEALALAINTVLITVALMMTVLVLAGTLGVLMVRQIVQPIQDMAATAEAISAGDLSRQVAVTRQDELGILGGAFNRMTSELRNLITGLEQQIAERRQAEKALRESEERLRQAIQVSRIGIFDHDHPADTIYMSPEYREMWGWGAEKTMITLSNIIEQVYPEDCERFKEAVQGAHNPAGDGVLKLEYRILRTDGAIRWLTARSQTYFEGEGRARHPVRTIGAVLDITESREAEEALRIKDNAITSAINAIVISDADGYVTYVNPSFLRMWGYDDEQEILGRSAQELWTYPPEVVSPVPVMETMLAEGSWIGELPARKKDGSWFDAQLSASMVKNQSGDPAYLMGSVIDITERKRAERMLQTLNAAALAMQSALIPDQIFIAVSTELQKVGFQCAIFATSEDQSSLIPRHFSYRQQAIKTAEKLTGLKVSNITFPIGRVDAFKQAIWERQTIFVEDVQHPTGQALPGPLKKLAGAVAKILQIQKTINAPLIVEGEVIGLFSVQSNDLSERDMPAITAFANQLAAAWRQSQLFEQAQQELAARQQAEQEIRQLNEDLEQRVAERTRQLQEALTFQQKILRASSIGITVYDATGQCVLANEASAKMIEATLEQVLAQNYHQIPSWQESGLYETALAAVETGLEKQQDIHVVSTFGKEVWLNCKCIPFDSGGQPHLLLTVNDMTERMQAENEIRELNQQLQAQANNLAAANKELEAFSYSVSHDLRAPLRAIDGYTRILVEDYEAALDAEGQRVCAVIRRQTQRMGQLIDDLLAFSRLSRTHMRTSSIDMESLVNTVLHEVTTPEDRKRIEFQQEALPPAVGDPALIRQVWINLFSNAVKFSAKRERAVIELGSSQEAAEDIYFVRDNGAGFEMQYADKLFGVFQRLHTEREFEGTGVGLAIVQRIIHRHGGRVWAESEVDQGATFYFTLPRKGDEQ